MATGKPVGTMFVELDLDATKYTNAQKAILAGAEKNSADINKVFKTVGTQTDQMYDAMRKNIENALNAIVKSHTSSHDEIRRAQESAAQKITAINEQQFGKHNTLIDSMKQNWVAASVAVVAAWALVNKAVGYMDEGAKAMQIGSSFKILADEAGVNSGKMIESMKQLTKHTVDDSDLMQKANKLMLAGYNPEQIERFSKVAITASQYMGVTVSESFERLSDALASRMPKAMVQAGAVTRDQMKLVTAAIAAGADQASLFELAIANLTVKQLQLKGTQDEATLSLQRFHAQAKETREQIGIGLVAATQKLYGVFQALAGSTMMAAVGLLRVAQGWAAYKAMTTTGKESEAWGAASTASGKDAETMWGAALDLRKKASDNITGYAETEKKASAQEITDAKATRDALLAKLQATVDGAKNAKDLQKAWTDENKKVYEREIEMADHAQKMKVIAGMDERNFTIDTLNTKETSLDNWYDRQAEIYNKTIKDATVREARLEALDADYAKKYQIYSDQWDQANEKSILFAKQNYSSYITWKKATDEKARQDRVRGEAFSVSGSDFENINLMQKIMGPLDDSQKQMIDEVMKEFWGMSEELASYYEKIGGQDDKYYQNKMDWIEKVRQYEIAYYGDVKAANAKAAAARNALDAETYTKKIEQTQQIATDTASLFEGMSQLYAKDSEERKRLHDIAMGFLLAEKIAAFALAVVKAVEACANAAANGDPYTAVARIAAVAAALGAVFASAGMSMNLGGGAGGDVKPSLPDSTVLGAEAGTASASIVNSLKMMDKILGDTFGLQYRELRGIHQSMKDLNENITGLVRSLILGGGNLMNGVALGGYPQFSNQEQRDMVKQFSDNMTFSNLRNDLPGFDFLFKLDAFQGFMTLLPKLFGDMFGGEKTATQIGGGISYGTPTVGGLESGQGINARQYAQYKIYESGGWFGSSKEWIDTEFAAASEDVNRLLTKVYKNMSDTLISLTENLGTDMQKTLAYAFPAATLNLMGQSGEQITKTLKDYFSQIGDVAVNALFGEMLRQYQDVGEGMMETAIRIITDKAVIMETLKMTGQTFVGTTKQVIAFSEALIDMAGGLDKLTEAASYYYDNFYSDSEKLARSREQMQEAFTDLGYAMPQTRDAYRDLVESLDLTTTAGQKAYVTLLTMAEASDKYYDALDEIVGKLRDARESMKMEGMVYAQKQATSAQLSLMTVLEQARQGNFANIGSLDKSLSTLTSSASSTALFSTRQEYEANFYRTYNRLAELEGIVGGTVPIEEQQLAVLQQIAANTDPNVAAAAAQSTPAQSLGFPESWLTSPPSEALLMGMTGTVVIPPAMQAQIDAYRQYRGYAAGGDFAGGWRMVGEQGPELEYTGASRIFSNKDSKSLIDNSELVNEVKQLRQELYAATYQIAKNTAKSAKITDRWDVDGLPSTRT